jgi:hypothetical protein
VTLVLGFLGGENKIKNSLSIVVVNLVVAGCIGGKMGARNILLTAGLSGQNIMIDMDNSKIVVTQSAANAWGKEAFMLNVIRDGKLPD